MIEKKKVNLLGTNRTHVQLCGFSIHPLFSSFFLFNSFSFVFPFSYDLTFFARRHSYLAIRNSNRAGTFLPRNNLSVDTQHFCLEFQVRTRLITRADACCECAAAAAAAAQYITVKQLFTQQNIKYSLD